MSENPIQLFIATFDNEVQAKESLNDFQAMDKEGSINLIDAAVIVRGADGKVKFEETADPSGKKWAKRGAIAGGVVGLIFPPSLIASAVVGGGAGGIWGKIRDKGFKDEDLKAMERTWSPVPPRSSLSPRIASSSGSRRVSKAMTGLRAMPSALRLRLRSQQRALKATSKHPDPKFEIAQRRADRPDAPGTHGRSVVSA